MYSIYFKSWMWKRHCRHIVRLIKPGSTPQAVLEDVGHSGTARELTGRSWLPADPLGELENGIRAGLFRENFRQAVALP